MLYNRSRVRHFERTHTQGSKPFHTPVQCFWAEKGHASHALADILPSPRLRYCSKPLPLFIRII